MILALTLVGVVSACCCIATAKLQLRHRKLVALKELPIGDVIIQKRNGSKALLQSTDNETEDEFWTSPVFQPWRGSYVGCQSRCRLATFKTDMINYTPYLLFSHFRMYIFMTPIYQMLWFYDFSCWSYLFPIQSAIPRLCFSRSTEQIVL